MKNLFKQLKKKVSKRGNQATRSKAKHVYVPRGIEYQFKNEDTKFYLRPPSFSNKKKWKKYPVPHVWDNWRFINGGEVQVRKFYADGEVMPFVSGKYQ